MKKRFLSILLTLVMVIGMFPMASLTAHAEGSGDDCYIDIGPYTIDDLNVAASGSGTAGTWTYTPGDTPTITLNNYKGGKIHLHDLTPEDGVESYVKLKIEVNGDCEITASDYGIFLETDTYLNPGKGRGASSRLYISFSNNASLTINADRGIQNKSFFPRTWIQGSSYGSNANLNINAASYGIRAGGSLVEVGSEGYKKYGGEIYIDNGLVLDVKAPQPFSNGGVSPSQLIVNNGAMVSMTSTTGADFINDKPAYLYSIPDEYAVYKNANESELLIYVPNEPVFTNQNPKGNDDETTALTYTAGDTVDFTFDGYTPNGFTVKKSAKLRGLFAGLDADQTIEPVTGSSAATLTHTFGKAGLYQLTETLDLYFGSQLVGTKTHSFLIEVAAAPAVLDDIEITRSNTNMAHTNGQEFDKKRIEVTANYSDGSSKVLNDSDYTVVYQNGTALKTGDTYVTIKYTEDGVTKTTTKAVTVTESQYSCEFNSYDDLDFGTANVGYTSGIMTTDDVKAKSIVVEATGSGYHSYKYEISDTTKFEVVQESEGFATGGSEPGDTDSIRIAPKEELPAGVYNETVYVYVQGSGVGHTFNLKFVVSDGHEHTYTTDFNKSNEFYHWRECTDPTCTASDKGRKDVTPHNWDVENPVVVDPATCTEDGVGKIECTICDAYQNITVYATGHNWGEWNNGDPIITPPCTAANDLVIYRTCNNANCPVETESKTISRIHMAMDWTTDENYHWKVCGYCHEAIVYQPELHTDTNSDNKCDTCEYDMTPEPGNTIISSVKLTGFTAPSAGVNSNSVNPTVTAESDKGYDIYTTYWCNQTGTQLDTTVFEAGNTYYARFVLLAKDGYQFSDSPSVTVNGNGAYKKNVSNDELRVMVQFTVADSGTTPPANTYTVTLTPGTGYTATAVAGSTSPVAEGGSYSFTVTIASGYKKGADFAVKANGTELTEESGKYTITNITTNQVITVEGVVEDTPVDPEKTATPEITYDAETFTVTATGNGTVKLYKDGVEVSNPCVLTQTDAETTYTFTATAQEEGKLISETATKSVTVPAKVVTPEPAQKYTITYTDGVDGKEIFADVVFTDVEEGSATPTISNPTRSGYTFTGWTPAVAATVTGDQTYTATWDKNSTGGGIVIPTVFPVTVKESDNGEVEASAKYAVPGSTVKLTVTPDEGYELDTLTVKYGSNEVQTTLKDGKYQFTMPFAGVTVTATFKKLETPVVPVVLSFDDVAEDTYYFDAVEWAVENGITTGTSDTTFSPNVTCTRAQAVTFLWRAAGSPEPKSNVMPFEDVAAEAYYYTAVLWAVENGITNGTSATTFSPNAECTRAQIVTFLWRSQKSPEITAVNPFADVAAEAYYYDAVLWAVDEKITNGTSETTFSPDADCTRAQIVTFLYRCLGDK